MAFKLMQAIHNALNQGFYLQLCEVNGLVIIYKRAKPNLVPIFSSLTLVTS
jgi:hypothetical protein